jgi:hypothetical protein
MPQHSNGKAISRPRDRNRWRLDPELWSANRTEHRFADGHELVAFDCLPRTAIRRQSAGNCSAGLDSMTLVASGQAASLREAKTPARRRWFRRWWLSDVRPKVYAVVQRGGGTLTGATPSVPSAGFRWPWLAALVGFATRAWGLDGDARRRRLSPLEPDRDNPLRLAFSCWFRQSAKLLRGRSRSRRCCWGQRDKPPMPDCCGCASVRLSIDGPEPP